MAVSSQMGSSLREPSHVSSMLYVRISVDLTGADVGRQNFDTKSLTKGDAGYGFDEWLWGRTLAMSWFGV